MIVPKLLLIATVTCRQKRKTGLDKFCVTKNPRAVMEQRGSVPQVQQGGILMSDIAAYFKTQRSRGGTVIARRQCGIFHSRWYRPGACCREKTCGGNGGISLSVHRHGGQGRQDIENDLPNNRHTSVTQSIQRSQSAVCSNCSCNSQLIVTLALAWDIAAQTSWHFLIILSSYDHVIHIWHLCIMMS